MSSWYIKKYADYEQYREEIEELSKSNPRPFNGWFGDEDRLFVPFVTQEDNEVVVEPVVQQFLDNEGCQITDYRAGHCTKNDRKYKIGRLIQQALKRDLKQLELESKDYQVEAGPQIEFAFQELHRRYQEIMDTFTSSSSRNMRGQSNFSIVFSDNPKDIAMMSTERGWTSCMDLGGGVQRDDVYCEIESGGFVAYLVRSEDKQIEKPYARVHIRRFENKDGVNIAISEDSVYGNNIPGFKDAVDNWLREKQGDIPHGFYDIQGAEWSDTYDPDHMIGPTNPEEVIKWFRSETPMVPMEQSPRGVEDEEYIVRRQRSLAGKEIAIAPKGTYPEDIVSELIEWSTELNERETKNLIKNYYYLYDEEHVKSLPPTYEYHYINSLPPEEREDKKNDKYRKAMLFFDEFDKGSHDKTIQTGAKSLNDLERWEGIEDKNFKFSLRQLILDIGREVILNVTEPITHLYDEVPEGLLPHLFEIREKIRVKLVENGVKNEWLNSNGTLDYIDTLVLGIMSDKGVRDDRFLEYVRGIMPRFYETYLDYDGTVSNRTKSPISISTASKWFKSLGPLAAEFTPMIQSFRDQIKDRMDHQAERGHNDIGMNPRIAQYDDVLKSIRPRGSRAKNWYKANG